MTKKKYKTDLIPPQLLAEAFFPDELAEVERLGAEFEGASVAVEEFVEEFGLDEEAPLSEVVNDKGKVTKTAAKARLKELGTDETDEEHQAIEKVLALLDAESAAKSAEKQARTDLYKKVLDRYSALTEDEVKSVVVDQKWLTSVRSRFENRATQVARSLARRIRELDERYATPLPQLEVDVESRRLKVKHHLQQMGIEIGA